MKIILTESNLKYIIKNLKSNLKEEIKIFSNLNSDHQEKLFDLFKKSYEKSIGTSWTKDKFYGRAKNWLFFGDDKGFVAVRKQNSGLYKLVGVGGDLRGILSGLEELMSLNVPVWGMVSSDIQKMVMKKGFKTPPTFLLKVLLKFIPKSVFGGVDYEINSDGSLTLKYEDVGDARKYFIGNDAYFKELKKSVLPQIKDKVPSMVSRGIKMFLGENETQLDEVITSGSVIVYHRTGKNGSPIEGISSDGFRVGGGAAYGVGVYTTYTLESQLKPNMRGIYGNIVIESKVLSMDRFLIFDYDIAKKIYGSNFTLDKQLQRILGKEWNNYKNNSNLKSFIERIPVVKYTSEIANPFVSNYPNIVSKLRGMVFTGSNDGNVLVSYDRKNVEPLRYTLNEGETWTNILNKNIYKRQKGYNTEESDTELEHIINKLDVGKKLNDEEIIIFLKNNNNKAKIKEYINKLDSHEIFNLLKNSKEPDKIMNILGNKGIEFINILDSNGIYNLLGNSNEPDKVINTLLSSKEFINNLDSNGIYNLLRYSKERDKVINTLLSLKEFINILDSNGIFNLLGNSKEPDKVINVLLSSKGFINKLDSNGIYNLFYYSKERDKVINTLLSSKEFINNLDSRGIHFLLRNSKEPDKVINILFSSKGFINKLDLFMFVSLLKNSKEPDKIMNILGNKGIEFINNLDSNGIFNLLKDSKEPDKVMNILGNKGIEFINNLESWDIERLLQYSNGPEKIMNTLGNKGIEFINKLNYNGIYRLLKDSKEPDKVINTLLSIEEFINKLDDDGIYRLLHYSNEPDKLINALLSSKEFINNLDSRGIRNLLIFSNEPEKIMNILGNKGIEFINKLSSDRIDFLLRNSKEPDKIKELLKKYRPDIQLNESRLKLSNFI